MMPRPAMAGPMSRLKACMAIRKAMARMTTRRSVVARPCNVALRLDTSMADSSWAVPSTTSRSRRAEMMAATAPPPPGGGGGWPGRRAAGSARGAGLGAPGLQVRPSLQGRVEGVGEDRHDAIHLVALGVRLADEPRLARIGLRRRAPGLHAPRHPAAHGGGAL